MGEGQEDAHLPHVEALIVALTPDHLGRQVVGRAAKGSSVGHSALQHVGPAEVGQLGVLLLVQQDVLGLDVPSNGLENVELWA